jgi:hypothetical protein
MAALRRLYGSLASESVQLKSLNAGGIIYGSSLTMRLLVNLAWSC